MTPVFLFGISLMLLGGGVLLLGHGVWQLFRKGRGWRGKPPSGGKPVKTPDKGSPSHAA